ncbi:MAG: hypothetical protein KA104_00080 [Candidatus Pacebacteria bacterium]|nr:hypothetical protein [Candidatus Paceibacterota bacterium]
MTRKLVALFIALLLTFGAPVQTLASVASPTRHSFCAGGVPSTQELARRIDESLKKDSSGKRSLEGCRANPNQFLSAFQANDKEAGLANVYQLANFVRTQLVLTTTPVGQKYWSACILNNGSVLAHCISREPHAGEKVWMNKTTGKIDLQGDCANPVEMPDIPQSDCIQKYVYLKPGDEHHIGLLGPDMMPPSACLALLKAGETEWNNVVLDECPRCSFEGPSKDLGLKQQSFTSRTRVISYTAQQEGWYKLRLPKSMLTSSNVIVDCIIKPDGTQSRGMVTDRYHYRKGVAYLGYAGERKSFAPDGKFTQTWVFSSVKVRMR